MGEACGGKVCPWWGKGENRGETGKREGQARVRRGEESNTPIGVTLKKDQPGENNINH